MIDIDVSALKEYVINLEILIKEYEEIKLNLFNRLKESCVNWTDGNSLKFSDAVHLDRQESELFIQSLKSKKAVFDFIYEQYSKFGSRVKCNLDNEQSLQANIDDCINQANSIINEFDKIDSSLDRTIQSLLETERKRIMSIIDSLKALKKDISKIFNEIENIEREINIKLKNLETIKINEFDFNAL